MAARLAAAGASVLLALAVAAGTAQADGDPASDVLFAQTVFLPITAAVSGPLAAQLEAATKAASKEGRPIRVALIARPGDLGAVPGLFGKPAAYARFLGLELQYVYKGRLLVVMPQGAALSLEGRLVSDASVGKARVEAGADGLARTALALVQRLAPGSVQRAKKRPKPQQSASRTKAKATATSSAARTVSIWKAAASAVGAVVALLLVGGLVVRWRRRRLRSIEPTVFAPPDPNDPYAYRDLW